MTDRHPSRIHAVSLCTIMVRIARAAAGAQVVPARAK